MERLRVPSLSLRTRFLLAVLIGAVLPFTVLSAWLVRGTGRAGETLLRAQLEAGLAGFAAATEERWTYRLSDLLLLSQNLAVRQALSSGSAIDVDALAWLDGLFVQLEPTVISASIRTADGEVRWEGGAAGTTGGPAGAASRPMVVGVAVRVRIPQDSSAPALGVLEAVLRPSAILAADPASPVPGATLVAYTSGGVPLLPDSVGRELLVQPRFEWNDARWVSTTRRIDGAGLELALAAPAVDWVAPLQRTVRIGTATLLAVVLASVLFAVFVIARLTRTLAALTAGADNVARGVLDEKIEVHGDDEIARVGRAFNAMTENLSRTLATLAQRESLAAVGEFASSLAHEIRNGHTSVRLDLQRAMLPGTSEADRANLLARTLHRIENLDRNVTGALRIARSGHVALAEMDLRTPVENALRNVSEEASRKGVRIDVVLPDDGELMIRGDSAALEQAVLNLLLNAIDAAASMVEVRLDRGESGGSFNLRIRDDGQGIPADQIDRVFEPFYTTRRTGTGLGLTIARRIVQAHGGEIRIESGAGGTVASLMLPACGERHRRSTT